KGTYIVLLKSEQSKNIQIGKLAQLEIRKGYYIYIGSALGPGGVLARLKHHSKISRKPHWHLDYLRAETEFYQAYALLSLDRKECEWAVFMAQLAEVSEPMEGFGSSDCNCNTHLFYCSSMVKAVRAIRKISQARKVAADRLI
ncbi:MAG: GIY-YIG nuclease family protein, partial [Gammaproteobacteria bacterium]